MMPITIFGPFRVSKKKIAETLQTVIKQKEHFIFLRRSQVISQREICHFRYKAKSVSTLLFRKHKEKEKKGRENM